jgi:hypothetical protein
MRYLILMVAVGCALVAAQKAWGQDVVVRPTGLAAAWKAQVADQGLIPSQLCLVEEGADYMNPATHQVCEAVSSLSEIALGGITTPMGSGDKVYRCVAVSSTGVVSEPSANTLTVQDIPLPPSVIQ